MGLFFFFLVATREGPMAFETLPGTQQSTNRGVVENVRNNIRLESRLAPPEVDVEADEVRGPRRFGPS